MSQPKNPRYQGLPEDIKHPRWLDVIRRLQSVAGSRGMSRLTITVFCDADGYPTMWTEPEVIRLEPAMTSEDAVDDILSQSSTIQDAATFIDRTEGDCKP